MYNCAHLAYVCPDAADIVACEKAWPAGSFLVMVVMIAFLVLGLVELILHYSGTQFACFTSTKVQVLTAEELQPSG